MIYENLYNRKSLPRSKSDSKNRNGMAFQAVRRIFEALETLPKRINLFHTLLYPSNFILYDL